MRQIKFRAWDKEDSIYKYPDLWDQSMPFNWHKFYILEQFTGLTDKNGKDIYEGDLVKVENWNYKYKCNKCGHVEAGSAIGDVQWQNEDYYDTGSRSIARFVISIISTEIELSEDCEVVGNIHENPELL